jgi:phosphate transport system substrate-binding protein
LLDIPRSEAAKLINFSGTNSSYTYLADGIRDLLISYEPPDEALRYKEEAEFEWDLAPIGRDALVFIVNDSNPVENITGEQAREIYTGEITNWKELGGADVEIEPFQRNETSGSQTLFIKLVMRDVAPMTPDKRYVQAGMAGLIESVASFNGTGAAIGYSVYYYAQNMNPADGLKFLGIDGVYPTRETVRDGSYPYVNDFYACVSSAAEADSVQRKIFDWLQTDEGRLLIENEGYVSVG